MAWPNTQGNPPISILSSLMISYYSIGDSYAKALSKSIQSLRPISIKLKGNHLSHKGASDLIENFSNNIKSIDLSTNKIGSQGIEKLCQYLHTNSD
jgi:hypothetical protein